MEKETDHDIIEKTSIGILESLENSNIPEAFHGPSLLVAVIAKAKTDDVSFKSLISGIVYLWNEDEDDE